MFQDVCRWVSYHTIVIVQVIKTVLCSSMYCHLFLISSASLRSLLFLSFITPILVGLFSVRVELISVVFVLSVQELGLVMHERISILFRVLFLYWFSRCSVDFPVLFRYFGLSV